MNEIIIQGIGFIGFILAIITFQKNSRKFILFSQMSSAFFYSIHFLLIGGITGTVMNTISILRNYVFYKTKSKYFLYIIIFIYILFGIIFWESYLSFLPIFAMISGSIAFWIKDTRKIRYLSLISPPLWFIYNYYVGSIPGILNEVFLFFSIIIGIFRFDRKLK